MKNLLRVGACTLIALSLLACGSDEEEPEPEANDGVLNEALVEQSATTAFQAAQTAIDTGDGQASAFTMLSVGTSALAMVTPGGSSQPMGADVGSAQQALGQGTCDCTENSCTFTDCGDGTGFTITGSISWTENSLTCDYSVGGSNGAQTFNYGIQCDLTYTATSLDGTLATTGDIEAGGQSTEFDTSLSYNMVTFDASGPTGGSIDVSASVSVGGQTYASSGSVSF